MALSKALLYDQKYEPKPTYKTPTYKRYPFYQPWTKSDTYPIITSPFELVSPFETVARETDLKIGPKTETSSKSVPLIKKTMGPLASKSIHIDDLPLKCITKESVELSTLGIPVSIKKVMESKLAFSSTNIFNPDLNGLEADLDHSGSTQNKVIRYKKMATATNIVGFIVNVHDATNFDIDLDMSPELHQQYQDVISNQYTYQDLEPDFIENPDFTKLATLNPKIGITYRCRLKGIGINQSSTSSSHYWKSNQMCIEVKQLMDRTDGWVLCTVSDIDVYQRLLVDISIETSNESINLRNYLLARMANETNPIFYPYSSKRYRNNKRK
jgi:hypothetical protein